MLNSARGLLLLVGVSAGYLLHELRGAVWGVAIVAGLFLFIDLAEALRPKR